MLEKKELLILKPIQPQNNPILLLDKQFVMPYTLIMSYITEKYLDKKHEDTIAYYMEHNDFTYEEALTYLQEIGYYYL